MKTISFSFPSRSWILTLRNNKTHTEDCPSPDAAPVPAYWLLRRRQPPCHMGSILGQGVLPCHRFLPPLNSLNPSKRLSSPQSGHRHITRISDVCGLWPTGGLGT